MLRRHSRHSDITIRYHPSSAFGDFRRLLVTSLVHQVDKTL